MQSEEVSRFGTKSLSTTPHHCPSWKCIRKLWGDEAMPSRPSGLTPTSSPTPLRQSDLSSAHPPPSVPACLCCPCFPAMWQLLALALQNSGVIHDKDWAEPGLLFISVAPTRSVRGGNTNPLQDCCLEHPMDKGAWGGCPETVGTEGSELAQGGSVLTLWAEFAHPISVDFHVTQRTRSWPPCRANCPDFLEPPGQGQLNLLQGTPAGGGRGKSCPTPPTPLGLREPGLRLAGGGVGGFPEAGS